MSEYETDLDYDQDCIINKENLHKEWLRQSSLAYDYKKHYVNLKKICSFKHEKLKTVRSELIRDANSDPDECCGKAKPTAVDIEAFYRTHKDYIKAKEDYLEAEYEMSMAEIAKDEIAFTRKKALEELGDLWKAEYYSIPDLPKTFGEVDQASKTSKGMKRRKKNG